MNVISAIVLAAGSSRRMGSPKSLLKLRDKTFLQHIVEVLQFARVLDIVIVLGSDADEIKTHLGWFDGKITVNEQWQNGQHSSIICGLNTLEKDSHGAMICPVDHPMISQGLIVDVLQAFWKSNTLTNPDGSDLRQSVGKIVVPLYNGRRGHPVIFSAELFDELRNTSPDVGACAVVQNHADDVIEVQTNEEGVVLNIDTPEDYETVIHSRLTG